LRNEKASAKTPVVATVENIAEPHYLVENVKDEGKSGL
jgi:hypothetical protein